ncbi:CinA (competence/damage-inducible) domain-containing protein [endosymbiont of Riftia pachyptila (vent Ph05)]|uniref:CinA (Competence/damage-inducible) domain-containing protein n=2 Tax=endosymbiont of Riftia pachyptila TaxID=54396 RepID=G2D9V5_9GAMM|nr:CinA (competence/damage-inducible) domain-containing protein [endosymbiont of Riftia pachyptila (vent Ph05)]
MAQMNADDQALTQLAGQLGDCLRRQWARVAFAESCTGGWIAKVATDVAGSSAWFEQGFVTYSNAAKQSMLGVQAETLVEYGAVSAQTVAEMTAGALQRSEADWAVAVSGIAGPGGGTPDKPLGTVWFAWQQRGAAAEVQRHCFAGDREAVRRQTVARALQGLLQRLAEDE